MKTGAEQIRLGSRLEAALAAAGLVVEHPVTQGAKIVGHAPVPGSFIVGVLWRQDWSIRDTSEPEPTGRATPSEMVARLAPSRFGKVLAFPDHCHGRPAVGPDGHTAHGPEDGPERHHDSTSEAS